MDNIMIKENDIVLKLKDDTVFKKELTFEVSNNSTSPSPTPKSPRPPVPPRTFSCLPSITFNQEGNNSNNNNIKNNNNNSNLAPIQKPTVSPSTSPRKINKLINTFNNIDTTSSNNNKNNNGNKNINENDKVEKSISPPRSIANIEINSKENNNNINKDDSSNNIDSGENTPNSVKSPLAYSYGWVPAFNSSSSPSSSSSSSMSKRSSTQFELYSPPNSFLSGSPSSPNNQTMCKSYSPGYHDSKSQSPTLGGPNYIHLSKSDDFLSFYNDQSDDSGSLSSSNNSLRPSPIQKTRRQLVYIRKDATLSLVPNQDTNVAKEQQQPQLNRSRTLLLTKSSSNLRGGDNSDDEQEKQVVDKKIDNKVNLLAPTTTTTTTTTSTTNSKKNHHHGRAISLPEETSSTLSSLNTRVIQSLTFSPKKINSLFNKSDCKNVIIEKLEEKQLVKQKIPTRKSTLPSINATTTFNKVIKELIETEADYLDDMEVIINFYLFASLEMVKVKILDEKDIFSIYSNVEELYHISLKLYEMLLKTIPLLDINEYPNIEEIFLFNSKSFQRYGSYLSSHESSNRFLHNIMETNQSVAFIFEYIKNMPMGKLLNLHSFLIKPCQRLCKYPLLLRELMKSIPSNDEVHHKAFQRSVKLMEKIVLDINGKITNDEKLQSIIKESGKEIEPLLHHQTFIKDSKIKKINQKTGNTNDAMIYLLNQRLIIVEKGTFINKKITPISLSNISRVCDHECKDPNGFGIYYYGPPSSSSSSSKENNNNLEVVMLIYENTREKLQWMNEIEDQIMSEKVLTGTYLYITDELKIQSGENLQKLNNNENNNNQFNNDISDSFGYNNNKNNNNVNLKTLQPSQSSIKLSSSKTEKETFSFY